MDARRKTKRIMTIAVAAAVLLLGIASVVVLRSAAASPAEQADATAPEATPEAAQEAKKPDGPPPVPVSVEKATVGAVSSYITATANLVPENDVKVLAEAEGRVTELRVEEGDRVAKGQLLAALDRRDAEIAYEKAKLNEANARQAYERALQLTKEDLVTDQDFDRTETEFRLAEQGLAEAKWRLDKTEIRAPIAGRVTQRAITVGQHVAPGAELFQVTSFEPLIAKLYLPEQDVLGLREGREVSITLKADERVTFSGRIRQISPVVDPATGTVKVTVEAVRPPAQVRPGGFVTVEIVRATHDGAVLVPRQAVIRESQTAHLFVVNDGKAERRDLVLGLSENGHDEVLSGVAAGESVVVAGQGNLKSGAAVQVVAPESQPLPDVVASR